MEKEKDEHTGGNTYINMTGGIFIKNIQHVEHLHAVPEKEEKAEECFAGLTKEKEDKLLPLFKGDINNLRKFFTEVQGLQPVQIMAKINSWRGNGKISRDFEMKSLWQVLHDLNIYKPTYQSYIKQVKK